MQDAVAGGKHGGVAEGEMCNNWVANYRTIQRRGMGLLLKKR